MQASSRAVPASDYINAAQVKVEAIPPVPCFSCDYRAHCAAKDQICTAWRDYDRKGRATDGEWRAADRVPNDIKIQGLVKKVVSKDSVNINGCICKSGGACHLAYEAIGVLGFSTIAEVRNFLRQSGAVFSDRTVSEAVQRLKRIKAIVRVDRAGWKQI